MGKPMTEQTAQEKPNQGFLASYSFDDADLETMIEVDHVSMIFNMASEQLHSLKEYAISLARRELSFKEFRALNDISLTVKRGDVFGIMGTNGSANPPFSRSSLASSIQVKARAASMARDRSAH